MSLSFMIPQGSSIVYFALEECDNFLYLPISPILRPYCFLIPLYNDISLNREPLPLIYPGQHIWIWLLRSRHTRRLHSERKAVVVSKDVARSARDVLTRRGVAIYD